MRLKTSSDRCSYCQPCLSYLSFGHLRYWDILECQGSSDSAFLLTLLANPCLSANYIYMHMYAYEILVPRWMSASDFIDFMIGFLDASDTSNLENENSASVLDIVKTCNSCNPKWTSAWQFSSSSAAILDGFAHHLRGGFPTGKHSYGSFCSFNGFLLGSRTPLSPWCLSIAWSCCLKGVVSS